MNPTPELEVGATLPTFVIDAVDRDPNPIHIDGDSVRALGLGDRVINPGPTTVSYVLSMVTRWSGGVEALRLVQMRFLGNVFGGERVECGGVVTGVDRSSGTASLDVHATAGGRPVLQGTIVVAV